MTSYIKISQGLKLKSKDITSKTLHTKFYASRIKNKRIRRGDKIRSPRVWSVFKSPGKIGLNPSTGSGVMTSGARDLLHFGLKEKHTKKTTTKKTGEELPSND